MVNRALTSLSLRSFLAMVRAGSPASSTSMSSIPARRQPSQTAKDAVESRSPFVRLTDLIAGIPPGKPVINLYVGEPQHPVPAFVAPVLAAHIADFGRYPPNKGIEPFRKAVAAWLGRRFKLPRTVDPESE